MTTFLRVFGRSSLICGLIAGSTVAAWAQGQFQGPPRGTPPKAAPNAGPPPGRGGPQGIPPGAAAPNAGTAAAIERGRALMQQRQPQAALAEFEKAVASDPKNYRALGWRATAKSQLGRYRDSIPDYDAALAIYPREARLMAARGYAYYQIDDYGAALRDADAATAIDPGYGTPFNVRALAYSAMGEQDRAMKEIEQALRIDSRDTNWLTTQALIYNRTRKYDLAFATYNQVLAVEPRAVRALGGRGYASQMTGNLDTALADYTAALAINPRYHQARSMRGQMLVQLGRYAEAREDLNIAIDVTPRKLGLLLPRARANEMLGDFDGSLRDYRAVLAVAPLHGVATAGVERVEAKKAGRAPVANRTGDRVALVVGNSKYQDVAPLANPERDARLVASALERSGFKHVRLLLDATQKSLADALKEFAAEADRADWAVIYYAGHGIEFDGSNFLVPVDARYRNDADIPKQSVALDQLLNAVRSADVLRLVILDACRENPFAEQLRNNGQEEAIGKGLARIEPETGTLVAFATKHGALASDGTGQNSPFATALVNRMDMSGVEISQMFRLVHDDVIAATNKQQEPFTYGQLSARSLFFRR